MIHVDEQVMHLWHFYPRDLNLSIKTWEITDQAAQFMADPNGTEFGTRPELGTGPYPDQNLTVCFF